MTKITLAKALVVVKQLGQKMSDFHKRFITNFTTETAGLYPNYNPAELETELFETMEKLIELKTKIQTANVPIYPKILKMAELKGLTKQFQVANTNQQRVENQYNALNQLVKTNIPLFPYWTERQKDVKLDGLRKDISNLQDELNKFNNTTEVEVSFEI
jgi:hypothetical protein